MSPSRQGHALLPALALLALGLLPARADGEIVRAEVRTRRDAPAAADARPLPGREFQVGIVVLSGDRAGEELVIPHRVFGHRVYDYLPAVGDRVIVALTEAMGVRDGGILTREYAGATAGFLLALLVVFLALSRRHGLPALLGLAISLLLLYGAMFHLFRAGYAVFPVGTALVFLAAGGLGLLTFPKGAALPATAGVWVGLAAVLLGNRVFFSLAHISGVRTDPGQALRSLANTHQLPLTDADLTALLMLGSLIAVTGILIDLGAVLAAVITEVRRQHPGLDRRALRRIGTDLGRELFPPLFNTLLLSYAGLALPFFALAQYLRLPWLAVLNYQVVGFEIVSLVASGLGMMAACHAIPWALTAAPAGGWRPARSRLVLLLVGLLAGLATFALLPPTAAFELPEESELKVHPLLEAGPDQAEYFPARVVATRRDPATGSETVRLEGLAGGERGRPVAAVNFLTGNEHRDIRCLPGEYVLARRVTTAPPGAPAPVFVADYLRLLPLGFICLAFVLLYLLFCRRRAVNGLLALGLIVIACFYWLPRSLVAFPAVPPLALLLPTLALLVVLLFLLQYGRTRKNLIALAASLSALLVSLALAWSFLKLARLEGFSSEYLRLMEYLAMTRTPGRVYDYQLLTVAGMVVYSLGVIIDATVDAVSGLAKIHQPLPGTGGARPGFAPLRTIAVAMIGTLVFVSLGVNLMDFFVDSILYRDQALVWLNGEALNLEAGRIVCGSIVFLLALLFAYAYYHALHRRVPPPAPG